MSEPAFSFSDHLRRVESRYPYKFYYELSTPDDFNAAVAWIEERVGPGHNLEVMHKEGINFSTGLGELPYTVLGGVTITIADHDLAFEFRMRWC